MPKICMIVITIIILSFGIGIGINSVLINEHETQIALERAEQWYEVIQHSETAFIISDESDRITGWSDGATALFGWTEKDAIGATFDLIVPPPELIPDDHKAGSDFSNIKLRTELRKRTRAGEVFQAVGYGMNKDGHVFYAHVRIAAVINGGTHYVSQVVYASKILMVPPLTFPQDLPHDLPHDSKETES